MMSERNADRHRAVEHATDAAPSAAASRARELVKDWKVANGHAWPSFSEAVLREEYDLESRIDAALARATAAEHERILAILDDWYAPDDDWANRMKADIRRAGAPAERRP